MVFKCKICGGQTTVNSKDNIVVCDYCGTKQALPLFTQDSERLLYESGNHYLSLSEYDKAENVFNQLLSIRPDTAELYWDLVLCKYGVTYVKDPKTDKYIPTCNRTHYTPIFSDKNYLKAIELSSGEKRELFEEDAKTIDNIQKGIIAVSKKEKPFDIFISYKETDADGNRTKDSIEAQNLYEKLTEAGYKVFFSRITLEDKVGTEYEPYIYAALYSSKVMITICSSKENIEAVWVKNEWSRFLSLRQKDADKTVIPLYFDMDRDDLPEEFSIIPAFDIKDDGFEAELLRGIKKQIPLPIMIAKKRQARKKTALITLLSVLSVVVICCAVFLPGIIKEHIQGNTYEQAMQLFENRDYEDAKLVFAEITDYKDSKYMMERCDRQPEYDAAEKLYYDGEYAKSAWAFKSMGDYEDAPDMQKKAEASWRNSLASVCADVYYITENGTVTNLKGIHGKAHENVEIKENGKVVSIVTNSFYTDYSDDLTALHENGRVSHPLLDSKISDNPDWDNIIKVSHAMQMTGIIALRADGKMVTYSDSDDMYADNLEPLAQWSDIVDFQTNFTGGNGFNPGLIIGLKADGTLCATDVSVGPIDYAYHYDMVAVEGILSRFSNIKSFFFRNGDSFHGNTITYVNIVAITNDNKLLTYIDGEFTEKDSKDICKVIDTDSVLKTNGDLVLLRSGKVLLRDIVDAGEYTYNTYSSYAVTRNAKLTLNNADFDDSSSLIPEETENKTIIYDEWLSRLD